MNEKLGGRLVVVDVYGLKALTTAVVGSRPDLVMHHLTDPVDDRTAIRTRTAADLRIRTEGTAELLAA